MKKVFQSHVARAMFGGAVAGTIVLSGLTWTGQFNLDNVHATVQELVERVQGLDSDRTALMEMATELAEEYEVLTAKYNTAKRDLEYVSNAKNDLRNAKYDLSNAKNDLRNEKNEASDRYNAEIGRLAGELANLERDREELREKIEHANAQINKGQTEIDRLEAELGSANNAAAQLEREVNEMVAKVADIQPINAEIVGGLPASPEMLTSLISARLSETFNVDSVEVTVTDTVVDIRMTGGNFNNADRNTVLGIVREVTGVTTATVTNSASNQGQGIFIIQLG